MKEIIGGRYEFDRATDIIGRGGMGTVYRGKDTQTGRIVAIKQLSTDLSDVAFISRFMRESDVMRRLHHPHIVTIYDTVQDVELGYYLMMEYIGNGSLWDELQASPQLSITYTLTIAQQLASALMMVHEQGIIHRDIKPANVLIADDKSPRLSDFGVVHLHDKTRITETGGLVGTLDYLAPETLNGEPITVQSDIWALGVMFYEMLAGSRPFIGDSVGTIITNILTQSPINLADLRPDAPPNFIRLVEWMLVKNQPDRVAKMSIIHQILQEIIAGTDNIPAITDIKPFLGGGKILKRIRALPKSFTDTTFYDRDHQQTAITNAILDGKSFIGIYGRGGIGKTGLVSKVLGDFENRGVVDGVAYLRADSTPPLNSSTLLDTLGEFLTDDHPFHTIRQDVSIPSREKTQALLDGLSGGQYLIYIDNLETLQDNVTYALTDADMNQLFEGVLDRKGSPLTIIITSRYPIPFPNILKAYETIIRLDEGLPQSYAVQFLRQMDSQKVLPQTDTQLNLWVEKVGGFPRGLEALVGYLNGGDTRDIADLLDDRTLFEGEILSNIVHHIHDALPQEFRQVMAGVAVIGQATIRAELDYLLTPYMPSGQLRVILEKLVDSRFLSYNRQTRAYSLHPIDRDYALSSTPMGSSDDADSAFTRYTLNKRMAEYFLNQRKPEGDWRKLDDLTPQLREMEHRYFIGDYDAVATIFLEVNLDYLLEWGHTELVMGWHTKLEGKIRNPILVQKTIGAWGDAYFDMGNLEISRQKYTHTLSMSREQGDREGESVWLNDLGIIYANLGQIHHAVGFFEQALVIDRERNDKKNEGIRLSNLGNCYHELGQIRQAIETYEQGMGIIKELKNKLVEAQFLGNLGNALTTDGRYTEAIIRLHEAIKIGNELNTLSSNQQRHGILARASWFSGDISNAISAIRQAREYNTPFYNHIVVATQGCIMVCAGKKSEAQTAFNEALEFANDLLNIAPMQYDALYSQALAYAGLWVVTGHDAHYADALKAYGDAKVACSYAGVLLQHRLLLEKLLACSNKNGAELLAILAN